MAIGKWFRRKALPAPGTQTFFIDGLTSNLPRTVETFAREGYSANPIVFSCVSKIAEGASSVRLEVHQYAEDGDRKVLNAHPILKLLARPNPTQSWSDFMLEMASWHRIAGEVFVLRLPETGKAAELYLLNPAHVDIEKPKNGSAIPVAYLYGTGEKKQRYAVNQLDGTSQVLHIKTFNPSDPWRGLSPLNPAARQVDIHNSGSKWNNSLLLNSARPSGIVELEGAPDETTLNRLREFFKKAWQGVANAGNIPILTSGAKFTPLSHNPKDMDFQSNMSEAAKNTALVYGVPLPLITMDAATFSNMDAAKEQLWTDTILPLLDLLIQGLSHFLMPSFSTGREGQKGSSTAVLAYNADAIPALEPRRERLFNRMKGAVAGSLLTPDEARAEMGYDEMGGNAEKLLVAGSMKPLDKIGEDPAPVQPVTGLAKAMRDAGYTAEEVAAALPEFGEKAA